MKSLLTEQECKHTNRQKGSIGLYVRMDTANLFCSLVTNLVAALCQKKLLHAWYALG